MESQTSQLKLKENRNKQRKVTHGNFWITKFQTLSTKMSWWQISKNRWKWRHTVETKMWCKEQNHAPIAPVASKRNMMLLLRGHRLRILKMETQSLTVENATWETLSDVPVVLLKDYPHLKKAIRLNSLLIILMPSMLL